MSSFFLPTSGVDTSAFFYWNPTTVLLLCHPTWALSRAKYHRSGHQCHNSRSAMASVLGQVIPHKDSMSPCMPQLFFRNSGP